MEMELTIIFFIAAAVAVLATAMVITRPNAVHALLYLVVSLLAVAVIFYLMGAPFVAALEVIIYAGAIMVLFVFVIMMLNVGPETAREEKAILQPHMWAGPVALAVILLGELIYIIRTGIPVTGGIRTVTPQQVGHALFGPYLLGMELVSILMLAGLIGAWHLGRSARKTDHGQGGDR